MSELQQEPLQFSNILQGMEAALGKSTDILGLIDLIDPTQYVSLRNKIIDVFKVGEMPNFDTTQFGSDVEFGDISDAIIFTTMEDYPQGTPLDKLITLEERKKWCEKLLENMDASASEDY